MAFVSMDEDGNAIPSSSGFVQMDEDGNILGQAKEETPSGLLGVAGAAWAGAKNLIEMGRATGNVATGDNQAIEQGRDRFLANEANSPLEKRQFMQDYQSRLAKSREDDGEVGFLEAVGDLAASAWNNKMGFTQAMAEQAPNAVPVLAAGAAGAAVGSAFMPGVGTAIGGFLGMALGNAGIEVGSKAIQKAEGGLTDEESSEALREGSIKGTVIAGVDMATLGLGGQAMKALGKTAVKAGAMAEAKVLMDAGVNMKNPVAIATALQNKELATAAKAAGDAAARSTLTMGQKAGMIGTGLAMETAGEGVGEYFGEVAATGQGDMGDAVLEAFMGMGQSSVETAYNYNKSPYDAHNIRGLAQAGSSDEAIAYAKSIVDVTAATSLDVTGESAVNNIEAQYQDLLGNQRQTDLELQAIVEDAAQTELAPSSAQPVPADYIPPAQPYQKGSGGLISEASLPIIGQEQKSPEKVSIETAKGPNAYEQYQAIKAKAESGALLSTAERVLLNNPPQIETPQIALETNVAGQGQAKIEQDRASQAAMAKSSPILEQDAAQDELTPPTVTMQATPVQAPVPNAENPVTQQQLNDQESALGKVPSKVGGMNADLMSNEQLTEIIQNPKTHANTRRAAQAVLGSRMSTQRADVAELEQQVFTGTEGTTNGTTPAQAQQSQPPLQGVQQATPQGSVQPGARSARVESLLKQDENTPQDIEAYEVNANDLGSEVGSLRTGRMGKIKAKGIQVLMGMFGRKVVFYRATKQTAGGIHSDRDNRTIYVNVDTVEDPLAIVNHEFSHSLEAEHKEDYLAAVTAAKALLKASPEKAKSYAEYYNRPEWADESGHEDLARELIGDITGNESRTGQFWKDVFDEVSRQHPPGEARGIITRIRDAVVAFIDRLIKATPKKGFDLEGRGFTREELMAVRDAVVKMAAKSMVNEERRRLGLAVKEDSGSGDTRFSTNKEQSVASREDSAVGVVSANPGAGRYRQGSFTYKGATLPWGVERDFSGLAGELVTKQAASKLNEGNSQKWERLSKEDALRQVEQNGLELLRDYYKQQGELSASEINDRLDGVTNEQLAAYFTQQQDGINANFGPAEYPNQLQSRAKVGDSTAIAQARIKIHEGAASIIKSNKKWLEELFGLKNLKVTTVHGSFLGSPELSFAITADNMTPEIASDLASLLGVGFVQDQVVHRTPVDPADPDQFIIPSIILGNQKLTKLTNQELANVQKFAAEAGLDYTETTANDGLLFHYFGPESGVEAWQKKVSEVGSKSGLPTVIKLKLSSDIYDANIQQGHPLWGLGQNLRKGGNTDSAAGSSRHEKAGWELFVDRILAPYIKLISSQGFRVSPDRFALRYGITPEQTQYLRDALYPKTAAGSVAPILYESEKTNKDGTTTVVPKEVVAVIPSGDKANKPTNADVGFALANRATRHGQIEPNDYSEHAASAIARVFADEVAKRVDQENRPGSNLKKAKGWYEKTLKAALVKMAEVFPELAVDNHGNPVNPRARFLFNGILAVTSQGMDVVANFKAAAVYYGYIRQNDGNSFRSIKPDLAPNMLGDKTAAIQWNLSKFQEIIDRLGWQEAEKLMLRKESVAQLNKHIQEELGGMTMMDEDGKQTVIKVAGAAKRISRGWSVFGPKIGSFANNLYGDYSTLTADLWFSRTWNRVLGFVFLRDSTLEAKQLMNFRQAIGDEFAETWRQTASGEWKLLPEKHSELRRMDDFKAKADLVQEKITAKQNEVASEYDGVVAALAALEKSWRDAGFKTPKAKFKHDPSMQSVYDALVDSKRQAKARLDDAKKQDSYKKEMVKLLKEKKQLVNESMAHYSLIANSDPAEIKAHLNGDPDKLFDLAYVLYRDFANYGFKRRTPLNRAAKNFFEGSSKLVAAPRGVSEGLFQQEVAERAQDILRKKFGQDITIADIQALLWFEEKDLFRQFGAGTSKADSADYAGAAEITVNEIKSGNLTIEGEFYDVTDEADEAGPDAAGGGSVRKSNARVSYGEGQENSSSVEGLHYSGSQRAELDGSAYGKGMRGSERARLNRESASPIQWKRIHFYVNEGSGVAPESGVGYHAHAVRLNNLYNTSKDPLNLWEQASREYTDFLDQFNWMEQEVVNLGFDGVFVPQAQGRQGVAVLIGDHKVNVDYLGMGRQETEVARFSTSRQQYDEVEAKYKGTDQWMKAPNGNPTNLTERQWVQVRTPKFKAWFGDWEKHASPDSPVGSLWSDDAVSKVVDENGEPLVVHHGALLGGFTEFDMSKTDKHRSQMMFAAEDRETAKSYSGKGREINLAEVMSLDEINGDYTVYETEDGYEIQDKYGDTIATGRTEKEVLNNFADASNHPRMETGVYSLFLNIRNPLESDFEGGNWDGAMDGWYSVYDADGEIVEADNGAWILTENDAWELANKLGLEDVRQAPDNDQTTNTVGEEALRYGRDGAIIRNVVDDGGKDAYVQADDVFIFFDPKQAKSATQNTGQFGNNSDLRYSTPRQQPWYYSQLEDGVRNAKLKTQPATQWALWMKSQQFKKDELEWSGVMDYLALRGKDRITSDELADWLAENGVKVDDVDVPEGERAVDRFQANLVLPGGENYKELLITLPEKESFSPEQQEVIDAYKARYGDKWRNYLPESVKPQLAAGFRSSHFDTPNILAHIRMNERTDAEGAKILFLEELQSDFGQSYKKQRDAIAKAVDTDFLGIVERMKQAGVLEVNCD